jgi:hypothetical protein
MGCDGGLVRGAGMSTFVSDFRTGVPALGISVDGSWV